MLLYYACTDTIVNTPLYTKTPDLREQGSMHSSKFDELSDNECQHQLVQLLNTVTGDKRFESTMSSFAGLRELP